MAKIIFIEHSGKEHPVDSPIGLSVMQAAVNNTVPGIIADCGGNCSCATCHVYVDEAWVQSVPTAETSERDMLECAVGAQANSRLSCCIQMTSELDGIVIRLPESQY